jgi:dihydroneopterin aldolase
MSDLIRLVDMEVWARLGVPEKERAQAQRLLVTLELYFADLSACAADDDLSKTVDYQKIGEQVEKFSASDSWRLLETYTEKLAGELLKAFPIDGVKLTVKKFVLPNAAHVAVEMTRHRSGPPLKGFAA